MLFSSAALRLVSVGSTVLFARAFAASGPTFAARVVKDAGIVRPAVAAATQLAMTSSSGLQSAGGGVAEQQRTPSWSPSGGKEEDSSNPLLDDWSTEPYHLPPFRRIEPRHFKPAFEAAMEEHISDLRSIVDNEDDPTFENVIAAHDRAGALLSRVSAVFGNYCSSLNTDDMKAVQSEMSPILSRHSSRAVTLPGLFEKIDAVYKTRADAEDLTDEQVRLVERIHLDFTRQGADFTEEQKNEYAEIKAELASLQTEFMQNVMTDEETWEMVLSGDDLAGCPDSLVEAARSAAADRNRDEGEYVVTLSRSLVEPFLTFSSRRDLRHKAWEAWTRRGELHPDRDNLSIAAKILRLRKRQAELHGCATFSEYQCQDTMAQTPENVMELLEDVWVRAKEAANREREALEKYVAENGGEEELEGGIQPWDWRYYAEKVRVAQYSFDESALKPYLSLDGVSDAVMSVSNKLFGLRYEKKEDVEGYHPDVNVYEVTERAEDGSDRLRAVFLTDNYARPYKSSGAWMSEFRSQTRNLPAGTDEMERIPVVVNNNNFAKADSTLLSFDDAKTLFHECGHGHHGMLSDATYSRLSSTSVLRDFVELPSQLLERWLDSPEVLREHARHHETGEPVPDELLEKLRAAKSFNQGFATIEYTACALLDMALHSLAEYGDDFDITEFEERELDRLGMPQGITMRHRPAHFAHLFASQYYASGYYVYLWAEVLDADAFGAFEEAEGGVFDGGVAERARRFIYGAGNTVAPDELFRRFRGRDPDVKFMLEKKGLV